MNCIQNSCIGTPTFFNKVVAGLTCVLATTSIALNIIGLKTESSGPFNGIVQFDATAHGILLGSSLVVLTLDFAWIAALYKKTKEPSVSQPEFSQCESLQSALVITIEGIDEKDRLSQLPDEMILKVFGYLNVIELAKCGEVSKRWTGLASDATLWNASILRNVFPSLRVFDEKDWQTFFGLEIRDAPPLHKQIIPELKKFLSLPIERNAGATLLTIPKDLTINKLVHFMNSLKERKKISLIEIWKPIPEKFGNIPVEKTYRLVISNNILQKSRNQNAIDQKNLANKINCKIPTLLEVTVLFLAIFMNSNDRLYGEYPSTFTRCRERVHGYQSIVGCFSHNCLDIKYLLKFRYNYLGIVVKKKF
jgi:hypothetical protein